MRSGEPAVPSSAIDVAAWRDDEEWGRYPEGARPKSAHFPPPGPLPPYIDPQRRYLFKRSARRYPDQFWAEIVAYHIGCLLGIEVPPAYPAIDSVAGYSGALIEWFYKDGSALFVMGGHFMQQMIPDFDREKGRQHNFHSVRVLFRRLHQADMMDAEWPSAWCTMLLFDALCGNTDRHQDNWGILFDITRAPATGRLSPCYDNGTSLGHELSKEHQGHWKEDAILRYIHRGRHHIQWELGDCPPESQIEFTARMARFFPGMGRLMSSHLADFDLAKFQEMLRRLMAIDIPVKLTEWRADLMFRLVTMRRELLLEALR